MKKISSTVVGIPLRNTSPAAIEDFLLKKVRDDLGDLKDAVMIRPMLRIDREDGDLSGNVTDGFGTVMLTVKNKTFHLPFIIHQKELLPFDTIRLGEEEVPYDMSKLRRLVIALEKATAEGDEGEGNDAMSVVDIKDVPTHNGFLGTIMAIRNEHKDMDAHGQSAYRGDNFGDISTDRLMKRASANVEIAEVFEEFHEKLASVRVYSPKQVEETMRHMAKQAETESQKAIDSIKAVSLNTKDAAGVKREIAKVDETRLVDASRAASGNNVKFPVFDENRFEFRYGRVYSNFKNLSGSERPSTIKRVVVDSKGQYAFLTANDKLMLAAEQPTVEFDLPTERGRGISSGNMYAIEENTTTLSTPFIIEKGFREYYKDNGMLISVRERISDRDIPVDPTVNSIVRDAFVCQSAFGGTASTFVVLVEKGSDKELTKIGSRQEVREYIVKSAEHPEDASNAFYLVNQMGGHLHYVIGEDAKLIKFDRKIAGHFTRPDGLFKEGPMFHKEAAYDQGNKARLVINEQTKPATFTVEWTFSKEADVDGNAASKLDSRKMENLAPAQAKKILQDLGYDSRKQEMFFEIAKRNGRYAEFRLPDVAKAETVTPKDKGTVKAAKGMMNVLNSTLNAKNFIPVMDSFSSDGLTGPAMAAKERFSKQASTSFKVAADFEKVAETIRGKEWTEVAYLLNMKHHMDKLAMEISEGFVKDAEPVFKEAASLKGEIEKKASLLIDFNRQQLLKNDHPLVNPQLVKEAVQQFDELSGYIAATEVMEKQANFFHKGVRNQLSELGPKLEPLFAKQKELADKLRSEVIYLRTLEAKGLQGTPKHAEVSENAQRLQEEAKGVAAEIGALKRTEEELNVGMQNKNRAVGAAVGLPGIAALSYGYEGFKNS